MLIEGLVMEWNWIARAVRAVAVLLPLAALAGCGTGETLPPAAAVKYDPSPEY
jgi:predicted small lipoprotein YifL